MGTWLPGVPYTDTDADQVTEQVQGDRAATQAASDALVTNQAPYLTHYTAALGARSARIVNFADSLSADPGGSVTWRTWPYLLEASMARVAGSADVSTTTPSTAAAWRFWNKSINASSMTDHISAGLAALIATADPHLVIISCGVATWLTDKTGDTYIASVQAGIDAIRTAKPTADILVIHEHEPSLDAAAPNTFAGFGDTTQARTAALAAANDCAFVSLYRPFGTVAGDGDPRDVLIADLVHPNAAGQEVVHGVLFPLLSQERRSTAPASIFDLGQARTSSAAELSVLTAVVPIPANTLEVGDLVYFRAQVITANLTGGTLTDRLRLKIGGTTVHDTAAVSLTTFTGAQWQIEAAIFVDAISPSPIIRVETQVVYGPGSSAAATATQLNSTAASPLSSPTTAAIDIDVTSQHSTNAAGFTTECTWARLWKVPT
jgi:hypothetical protein